MIQYLPKKQNTEDIKSKELMQIFDNTNDHAICVLTGKGVIRNWNRSAERLTGYTKEEALGRSYSLLFSRESVKRKIPEKSLIVAIKRGTFKADNICIRKEGTFFWARVVLNSIKNKQGKTSSIVLILEDITERKEVERQKDEYIGIASHELKTPVSALSLYSELLADRLNLETDKKTLQLFQDIKAQIKRMVNLVEDLLVVNEVERNKLSINKKTFNLNKLIKQVIYDFQGSTTTHKIHFKGKIKGNVLGDPNRIAQVLVNLISNGIKYSRSANKIVVNLTFTRQKAIISVQDFGAGISPEEQRNIFRRYFRSYNLEKGNIPGLGLGLYISRRIIDKHQEKIWVTSKKGRGSIFSFTLTRE